MALPTASDNKFPKVVLDMQTSTPAAPSDEDWKLYAKPDGVYARSSNAIVGPFASSAGSFVSPLTTTGDMIYSSSGSTAARLAVGSNAVLYADGTNVAWRSTAGAGIGFIGASYLTTAGQSFTSAATIAQIDFATKVFDTNTAVTTGASWKFTAPVAGFYHVSILVQFAANTGWAASERALLQLFLNGTAFRTMDRQDNYVSGGSNQQMLVKGSTTLRLAASDFIDFRLTQNSGGTIALATTTDVNYIDIIRVG